MIEKRRRKLNKALCEKKQHQGLQLKKMQNVKKKWDNEVQEEENELIKH